MFFRPEFRGERTFVTNFKIETNKGVYQFKPAFKRNRGSGKNSDQMLSTVDTKIKINNFEDLHCDVGKDHVITSCRDRGETSQTFFSKFIFRKIGTIFVNPEVFLTQFLNQKFIPRV